MIDRKQLIIEMSSADQPPPQNLMDEDLTLQEGEHEIQTDLLNEDLKDESLISD